MLHNTVTEEPNSGICIEASTSVPPIKYVVGVWLMEQGSTDMNTTGTIGVNQIERNNRREVNL